MFDKLFYGSLLLFLCGTMLITGATIANNTSGNFGLPDTVLIVGIIFSIIGIVLFIISCKKKKQ